MAVIEPVENARVNRQRSCPPGGNDIEAGGKSAGLVE